MQRTRNLIVGLFLVTLSGCASINTPSSSLIDEKTVLTIGSTSNPSEDHIVFIPAKTEFPVKFSVKGEAFEKSASTTVFVSLKNNLYLYKYWASLDGKTWVNSHELLNVVPSGGFDVAGGKVEVELNHAK